jgi:DNA-binding NtrC family response regulator
VRELRNTLQRALACAGTNDVRFADLAIHFGERSRSRTARPPNVDTSIPFFDAKEKIADAFEGAYLRTMLAECEGNVAEASRRSGIARRHLYDLLKKHGLRA